MNRNLFTLIFVVVSIFLFNMNVSAKEEEISWGEEKIVGPNKVWSVKFNNDLNTDTLTEQNVYVKDKHNNKKAVQLTYDPIHSLIRVSPVTPYEYGETYNLWISKNLKSEDGKPLKQTVNKTFTIKNPEPSLEPTKVEFQKDVLLVEGKEIISVSDDLESITLEKDSQMVNDMKKGQIIMLPPSEEFPYQMARKVEKIEQSGNKVVLHTQTPSFEEVFKSINISYESPITLDDLEAPELDKETLVSTLASTENMSLANLNIGDWVLPEPIFEKEGNSLTIGFKNIEYKQKLSNNESVKAVFNAVYQYDNPRYITNFKYEDGKVLESEIALKFDNVSVDLSMDVGGTLTVSKLRKEFDLMKPKFRPFVLLGVPIPVGGLVTMKGIIEVSGNVNASMSAAFDTEVDMGIYKKKGDDSFKVKPIYVNPDSDFSLYNTRGNASISTYVLPSVSIAYLNIDRKKASKIGFEHLLGIDTPVGIKGDINLEKLCSNIEGYFYADIRPFFNIIERTDILTGHWKSDSITFYPKKCIATKEDLAKARYQTNLKDEKGDLYKLYIIPIREKQLHDENDETYMMMYPKGEYEGDYRIALQKEGSKQALWQEEELLDTRFYELFWEEEMAYTIKGESKGAPDIFGISEHETYNDIVARLYAIHKGKLVKLQFEGDEDEKFSILTANKPRYINSNTIQNVIFTRGFDNSTWKYENYRITLETGLLERVGPVKTYNLDNGGREISERWYNNSDFYVE